MIAAYVRVSSKAQTHDMQRHAIEQAARARGDSIGEWYAEKRSAKKLSRPELDRLRQNARTGIVGRLYVFKLDRLTRTGVADTYAVVSEFQANGCELIAVADNLHVKTQRDDVVTSVLLFALGLAAQLERQAINERIAASRERMEAQGKPWGRPSRVTEAQHTKARELKAQGLTIREIARNLHVPRTTIARALAKSE